MKYLTTNQTTSTIKKLYSCILAILFSITLSSCDGVGLVGDSSDPSGGTPGTPVTPPVTTPVSKTESRPVLYVNSVIVLEGEPAIFNVRLSKPATEDIDIGYNLSSTRPTLFNFKKLSKISYKNFRILSEKPTDSEDYDASTGSVTIEEGETSATITVDTYENDDGSSEGIEFFVLELAIGDDQARQISNYDGAVSDLNIAYIVDKTDNTDDNIDPKVYFPASINVTENQDKAVIPFVVYPAANRTISLDYSTSSSNKDITSSNLASSNIDYVFKKSSKQIPAGNTKGIFEISLSNKDDKIYEQDEDFTLNIFSRDINLDQEAGAHDTISNSITIPVTINDDEEKPHLVITPKRLTEVNGSPSAATVKLSWPSKKEVTVKYKTIGGTATSGEDYIAIADNVFNKLTFAPLSDATKNIYVALRDDNKNEKQENFKIQFSAATEVILKNSDDEEVSTLDATINIADNDAAPVVSLVSSRIKVKEGGGDYKIYLSLSKASNVAQTISYSLLGYGSNPADSDDYVGSATGSVVIAAGQTGVAIETGATILFNANVDNTDDPNEKLQLTLTDVTSGDAVLGGQINSIITILDEANTEPVVSVRSASRALTIAEGAAAQNILFDLSAANTSRITINYKIVSGSASSADYYTGSNRNTRTTGSLIIPAGDNSPTKSIIVNAVDDSLDEENSEKFQIIITSVTGAVRDNTNFVSTINITDNDSIDKMTLSGKSPSKGESAGGIIYARVTIPKVSGKDIEASYTLAGTATKGVDYIDLNNGKVIIPAGQTKAIINFEILRDDIREGSETIIVSFDETPSSANSGVTLTITENTGLPKVSFEASSITVVEPKNGSVARILNIPVTLNLSSNEEVNVGYTIGSTGTAGPTGTGKNHAFVTGPHTDIVDSSLTGNVTFAAGETIKYISITIKHDEIHELNETFKVILSAPFSGKTFNATLGSTKVITATIYDNDLQEVSTHADSCSNAAEGISGGTCDIKFQIGSESAKDIVIKYTLSAGSTNGATIGEDYYIGSSKNTTADHTVTILAGATSKTVVIKIVNDTKDEEDETVKVTVTSITNATLGGVADKSIEFTITDNDDPPTLQVEKTAKNCNEGTSTCNIAVKLSAVSGKDVTATYTVEDGTGAVSGEDYSSPSTKTVTITKGSRTANIPITIIDDSDDDNNETFLVALRTATNATFGTNRTTTATIIDND